MPNTTRIEIAVIGIDIGKNSFHVVGAACHSAHFVGFGAPQNQRVVRTAQASRIDVAVAKPMSAHIHQLLVYSRWAASLGMTTSLEPSIYLMATVRVASELSLSNRAKGLLVQACPARVWPVPSVHSTVTQSRPDVARATACAT